MTTHTLGQQANVSQQSSSPETKPVVRSIKKSEPIIFDLRERDDEVEAHIGDDDDSQRWKIAG